MKCEHDGEPTPLWFTVKGDTQYLSGFGTKGVGGPVGGLAPAGVKKNMRKNLIFQTTSTEQMWDHAS